MEIKYRKTTSDWLGIIEINSLEDLLNFRNTLAQNEEIIMSRSSEELTLEIYDDYRE